MANHQTSIKHDTGEDICQARCSCGWWGPLRNTWWSDRKPIRDSQRHLRDANNRAITPDDARTNYLRRLARSVY